MQEVWNGFCLLFLKKKTKIFLLVATLFLSFASALLEGTSFGFILLALNFLENQAIGSIPPFLPTHLPNETLFVVCIVIGVVFQILRSGFNLWSQLLFSNINNELQIYLQNRIYAQIMRLSFSCASRYKVGDLVEYAKAPFTSVHTTLDNVNKSFIAALNILALLGMMFYLSPLLTLLVVLIFGFLGMLQKYIIGLISRESNKLTGYSATFSADIVQVLHGLKAIFTFDRHKEILNKTSDLLERIAGVGKKTTVLSNAIPFINEVSGISLIAIFLIAGRMLGGENGSLPILLTFVTIAYRLNGKAQQLFTSLGLVAALWGQVTRIQEILKNEDKEFTDNEAGRPFTHLRDSIRLDHVTLYYPGRKLPAIDHFSLEIKKHTVTAFVGLSGAGKSSVLDLLLRLYEPTAGTIYVDQTPITHLSISSWRRLFGVVSQDLFIFNDTVEENIRFGQQGLSHDAIVRYARLAGADEFISRMPLQYQTLVGERGYRLSGGEKQRLSLARALVRDPEVLILDEATSNLDSKSELIIKEAMAELQKSKTLIIVAHRLSTIMHADKIIVMEHGAIKESGTHSELLRQGGTYAALWNMQSHANALS
jgi:ATP-binding cassette subfamily B protein/subfamily B ATP-binding cassette protein MsbA